MLRYLSLFILLFPLSATAQTPITPQKDIMDVIKSISIKGRSLKMPSGSAIPRKVEVTVVPALGFGLSTGLAAVVSTNSAFYLGDTSKTNQSNVAANANYTQLHQVNIPIAANIWTKDNHFNILTDWRFMLYPLETYGLGTKTTDADGVTMNFNYIRLYQSVLKNLGANWYAGAGYQLDYYYNTTIESYTDTRVSDAINYGFKAKSVSSGLTANILFDNRKNPINPSGGEQYANAVVRYNTTRLGSDNNWQSLLLDFRRYIKLGDNRHILAFWSYNHFTLSGNPPYQVLPSTGWDTYSNTGRGYVQSRFRGKNMVYLESEYRFPLTKNGLLSGVAFVNGQSFSEPTSNQFEAARMGLGTGVRLKLNKRSNTNIAIDYCFGAEGSKGFSVHLGEVF
jgi:hypothetical protein